MRQAQTGAGQDVDLTSLGIRNRGPVYHNLPAALLVERALSRGEGVLTHRGALCAVTGRFTGRSPKDKFVVREATIESEIWWGDVNQPLEPESFQRLHSKVAAYLQNRPIYVFDGFAGADPEFRISVRIVTEFAWHNLFARQLFLRPTHEELSHHQPQFTIISVPGFEAEPETDGVHNGSFIVLSLEQGLILIGGTAYAGEIKKSIFTVMNFLMPKRGVVPMHCSANIGARDDTALFFGLSGTGKTTLSADPRRRLIGDDEHGWSPNGIFNFEGGCYAKCIHLSEEKEAQIWNAIRFGAVLENVVVDPRTRQARFESDEITENTRAAYPIDFIPGAMIPGLGGHPRTILFLTADAFGVLPPISRLTPEQAMYHFISGYTSKLAGTETGVTEPEATFSACFGAPFLPLHPSRYAQMLGKQIERHRASVFLVNTGWTGGACGVGHRIDLRLTRRMVQAALDGELESVRFVPHPVFQVEVPDRCPEVNAELLNPRNTWKDQQAYDRQAEALATRFAENFRHFDRINH